MQTLLQDLRYGARMFMKNPMSTVVAIITLALGIGANTAIFSVINAVLLRPLPYPDSGQLVRLWESNLEANIPSFSVTYLTFLDWREQNQVFTEMAAYREDGFNLTGAAEPERVIGARVTSDFFSMLGVNPTTGRAFLPEEDRPGQGRVVILSQEFYKRRFAAGTNAVGEQLQIDGQPHTIVGIMPAGFNFPQTETEVWIPYALDPAQYNRQAHFLRVIARLKPGVVIDQALADMNNIAAGLEQTYPDSNKGWRVILLSLHESISGNVRLALYVLFGAVGLVLAIACANVANLLLARATSRSKEIAVRAALGASRLRLVRQLLTESMLLSLIGGVCGLLLASWGISLLISLNPTNLPRLNEIQIDKPILGFTLLISLLTGLIFGSAPAWQATRNRLNETLKDGSRSSTGSGKRLGNILVIVEVSLALMLMIGAGLLIRSFIRLREVDPGFNAAQTLTMELNLSLSKYPKAEQRAGLVKQAVERIGELPGVESVGVTHRLPLKGNSGSGFVIEGQPPPTSSTDNGTNFRSVSADYFQALGMTLVSGRTFTAKENWESSGAAIINETLARRSWPDQDPLGQRIKMGPQRPWLTVVGIVADVKESGLTEAADSGLYLPYIERPSASMTLVIRTTSEPLALAAAVRNQILTVDKDQAVSNISTLGQLLDQTVAQPRFNTLALLIFAATALILSALGIYSVIAYTVTQRTREIGIRLALGAGRRDVLAMVIRQGMGLALAGVGIGMIAAFALNRLIANLLFNVSTSDLTTFLVMPLILTGVALVACLVPARRATKVDPMVALRYE
jgi:putative ABC transport system permease protein